MEEYNKTKAFLTAVTATLFMLICAGFVHLWCGLELNILSKGASSLDGTLADPLPGITLIYYKFYRWGYALVLLPLVAAVLQLKRRGPGVLSQIFYGIGGLLGIAWVAICIIAWRVPYMIFNIQIGN